MRSSQVLLLLFALALSTLVVPEARTAEPTVRKSLSRAELRACIQREEELGSRQDSLRKASSAQELSGAKLSAEAMELSRILRVTDPNDSAAVDVHNKRNDTRNADVEAHNKRAEALNRVIADLQEAEADYLATCASKLFLQADESAVLRELGLKERRYEREKRQAPPQSPGNSGA